VTQLHLIQAPPPIAMVETAMLVDVQKGIPFTARRVESDFNDINRHLAVSPA
jgi:hypothetical protein